MPEPTTRTEAEPTATAESKVCGMHEIIRNSRSGSAVALTALAVLTVVAVMACNLGRPGMTPREDEPLKVMTYNVYVGTDVTPLLAISDPALLGGAVAALYGEVVASDFAGRAVAIAGIVKAEQPHVIGLQEISEISRAGTVELDFLEILSNALRAEDLTYTVAAKIKNTDLELGGVRLTDFDVILTRGDVAASQPMSGNYDAALPIHLPIPGLDLKITRGYAAVDVTVSEKTYRVVNTHLESTPDRASPEQVAGTQLIRIAQARQLVTILGEEAGPVVLLGDFNTRAPDGAAYRLLLDAGYVDVWQTEGGNTCCQASDLMNETSMLDQRIDLVFVKNVKLVSAEVRTVTVGDKPSDRLASGLWPSDHAGLVASLPVE